MEIQSYFHTLLRESKKLDFSVLAEAIFSGGYFVHPHPGANRVNLSQLRCLLRPLLRRSNRVGLFQKKPKASRADRSAPESVIGRLMRRRRSSSADRPAPAPDRPSATLSSWSGRDRPAGPDRRELGRGILRGAQICGLIFAAIRPVRRHSRELGRRHRALALVPLSSWSGRDRPAGPDRRELGRLERSSHARESPLSWRFTARLLIRRDCNGSLQISALDLAPRNARRVLYRVS
jgi:hypothetical protein